MVDVIDPETKEEAKAKAMVLETLKQKAEELTIEEIEEVTGLDETMVRLCTGRLYRQGLVESIPHSHTEVGLRVGWRFAK